RSSRASSGLHKLTVTEKPGNVAAAYEGVDSKDLGASEVPYVYLFFDETTNKFINPLRLAPKLNANAYTLEATLHAFNIKKSDQASFKNLKNQVQLGFNATAPATSTDRLTWLFMNAVDVFLAKDKDRPDQLTKFQNNNGPGTPLNANPRISIPKGLVNLQVTA